MSTEQKKENMYVHKIGIQLIIYSFILWWTWTRKENEYINIKIKGIRREGSVYIIRWCKEKYLKEDEYINKKTKNK